MNHLTMSMVVNKDDMIARQREEIEQLSEANGRMADGCEKMAAEIGKLHEVLMFARKRIEFYGAISDRRHFDHDLAAVYPTIDEALCQQSTAEK